MKLTIEADGERHELTLRRDEETTNDAAIRQDVARAGLVRYVAAIDERRCRVEAREITPNVYLLLINNRVYECRIERAAASGANNVEVYVGQQPFALSVFDPKRLSPMRGGNLQGASTTGRVVAPMPGKVVRLLVEAGAEVEAGAGLIVVEAMKMQNELKAPRAGKVTSINASVGTSVNAGDVLISIE